MKKLLAVILSLVILVGVLPISASADTETPTNNMQVETADISLSGTNSVGAMLAAELEKATQQNEGSGNVIYAVEVDGKEAYIELSTAVSCTLFVGVYTEDTTTLLSSGYIDVTPDDEYVSVTLDNEVPEYFYVKAFLIDTEDYAPLSSVYNNAMYTEEMQEFLSKTTDDFDEEKVVNFDDDKTNNFAVLSDDVVVIDDELENNNVVFADANSQIYILENIDETVSSLNVGDAFSCTYNDEIFIIKVGEISIDGTTATILGADAELEDVFDFVRLDGSTGITEDTVDPDSCGEGITFEGYEDSATTYASRAINVGLPIEKSAKFRLDYELTGNDNAKVTLNGNLILKTVFSPKVYISLDYKYVELKFDYSLSGGISVTGKAELKIPIAFLGFDLPGISAKIIPKFVVSASGKVSLSGTLLKGTVGYGWYSDVGGVNLCSAPKMDVEIKAEVIIFVGLRIDPEVKVLEGTIVDARIVANLGFEGKFIPDNFSSDSNKKHDCNVCMDGDIYGKFDLTVKGKLLKNEKWSLNYTLLEKKLKLWDAYWSLTYGEFGFTTCPHISYKFKVTVSDTSGKAISNAKVSFNGKTYTSSKNGFIEAFLPNGTYNVSVSKENYNSKEQTVYIKGGSKVLNVKLEYDFYITSRTLSLDGFHSATITENGDLYVWGWNYFGQLGDGTKNESLTPKKIMGDVASVSLGYRNSAVITKTGDLYMWGYNAYGQIGDGTTIDRLIPKKIMSNVESVDLGDFHSAAITKTGDLYMWGYNSRGQLGDGTTIDRSIPQKIMSNVESVDLGGYHSSAITKTGELYLWGENNYGNLGDGTTIDRLIPKKIMSNVATVSLGNYHSAAITKSGELYLWGENNYGQLGDGTNTNRATPVKIMSNVATVGLGEDHSAAITKTGDLYMWGYNSRGQLGDGTTDNNYTPKKIMSNVITVSLGEYHSAAIAKTGDLYMWGYNDRGQLGDGTRTDRRTPQKITLPTSIMMSSTLSNASYLSDTLEDGSFENLEPNSIYNFYIMKDREAENAFGADNLLYINQGVTDDTGAIKFDYLSDSAEFDTAEKFVVKLKNALPDNTVSDMTITASAYKIFLNVKDNPLISGGYENIGAEITVNGETTYITQYSENNGYLLFNCDISGEVAENAIITVKLFADYAGVTYEAKECYCTLMDARNDVNADGSVNTFDLVVLRDAFMGTNVGGNRMFDPNADGVIDARDLVRLKKVLAG